AKEVAGPFRKMTVEAPAAVPGPARVLPPLLAAVMAAVVVAVLLLAPHALLLPYPWHERERDALAQEQRTSLYRKIDRAAKTFFLLEGRFPEQLDLLRGQGLLARRDLRDPVGYPFQYVTTDESYILQPLDKSQPLPGTESTEAITGNFLLDPELVSVTPESTRAPLVLLD
ncbi:MAG TPA: hypothetical protein VHN15_00590, partial [Thermoanaerobaculia bacterium]|nr:hypothetical protein [Thermoanaerobaculia bacterium]